MINLNPVEYRQYAIEHLNISTNIKRIDRIVTRPNIAVIDDEGGVNPFGFANKIAFTLNDMGFRTERGKPELLLLTGHEPRIPEDMKDVPSILWHSEQVIGDNEHGQSRRDKIRELIPQVDIVIAHNPDAFGEYKDMGAKRVEYVSCSVATQPFCKLDKVKEFDIGFCGLVNDRRRNILNDLAQNYDVHILENADHPTINEFYNKCKIILNLHYTDGTNVETRLGEAMAAGAFVISEPLAIGHGIPFVIESNALESDILKWLDNDNEREQIASAGYEWIWHNQTLKQQLEKILELADAI